MAVLLENLPCKVAIHGDFPLWDLRRFFRDRTNRDPWGQSTGPTKEKSGQNGGRSHQKIVSDKEYFIFNVRMSGIILDDVQIYTTEMGEHKRNI